MQIIRLNSLSAFISVKMLAHTYLPNCLNSCRGKEASFFQKNAKKGVLLKHEEIGFITEEAEWRKFYF